MAKLGDLTVEGASGTKYGFEVYPFDTVWAETGAVYLVTKRYKSEDTFYHTYIYIGETGNLKERFENHHKADCFEENDANCICVHVDTAEKSRLAKEEDLLEAHSPPCND